MSQFVDKESGSVAFAADNSEGSLGIWERWMGEEGRDVCQAAVTVPPAGLSQGVQTFSLLILFTSIFGETCTASFIRFNIITKELKILNVSKYCCWHFIL